MNCKNLPQDLSLTLVIFSLFSFTSLKAQLKWDGGGNDGQWLTAANWVGDKLPSSTDDVLLDNSFLQGAYAVTIPPGNVSITVKSLTINPGTGLTIELKIPATNTAVPALSITSHGYALIINNGGVFRNASGAASGAPLLVTDSIQVNNGGRFIHNTQRSHATNVAQLSRAAGTEGGIFEFDIPAASSTISLSDRTYGKLLLSSSAAGGTATYTASGTNPVMIRNDLETGPGTSLSLNFSDTFTIGGNIIQHNSTINLGNSTRSLVLNLNGNILQFPGSIITESGTGLPELLLNGNNLQVINCTGKITNSVSVKINNHAGVELQSPLTLPYKLVLLNGIINTTQTNLLTLQAGCSIQADSLSSLSFINGPLKKMGLQSADFLFPVGKDLQSRWLKLKNASGNFTVTYHNEDPRFLSTTYSSIDHISQIESWSVVADSIPSSANIELSFIDPNSGGVTNLANLCVASLEDGIWKNRGNITVTGTAGFRGSVESNLINPIDSINYFTLGSSSSADNPLPLGILSFRANKSNDKVYLSWETAAGFDASEFIIERAGVNNDFQPIAHLTSSSQDLYSYMDVLHGAVHSYRVRAIGKSGEQLCSKIAIVAGNQESHLEIKLFPTIARDFITLSIISPDSFDARFVILDLQGRPVKVIRTPIVKGKNQFTISLTGLAAGVYRVFELTTSTQVHISPFIISD